MSRATYVKHLEHDINASKKTIDELTKEVHELREQLKATQPSNERTHKE